MGFILSFCKSLCRQLFGELNWSPPGWLRWIGAHRMVSIIVVLAVTGLVYGTNWYQHRPKPLAIHVTAEPIGLTPLVEKAMPPTLRIHFDRSATPLAVVGKVIKAGLQIDPQIDGEWRWQDDRNLIFQPRTDWPAGQTYRVRFLPGLVRSDVSLDRSKLDVATSPFVSKIREFSFYQNPKDPAVRQLVATLEFSHPVPRGELEANITLGLLGGQPIFANDKPPFTLEYGLQDRIVYLRSSPIQLPNVEDFAKLELSKKIRPARGKVSSNDSEIRRVKVPDRYSFFRINSIKGDIAKKTDGEPEQILIMDSTAEVKPEIVAAALEMHLLPPRRDDEEPWQNAQEISPDILAKSTSVPVVLIPAGRPTATQISFKFKLEQNGHLYVRVKKNIEALGGYPLKDDYATVITVPEPPQELTFQGEGGLLALKGERKLSVKSRGIPGIRYELARVQANQINHLISQTEGDFQHPEFLSDYFNEENISRIAEEKQPVEFTSRFPANYSTFDFSSHLAVPTDGGSERGLFFLRARAWNPKTNSSEGPEASTRFILVTDLGLLAKFNSDGSRDVFVMAIKTGVPAVGVKVDLLGKNGEPLVSQTTGIDGRVTFPKLNDTRREKEPVAFVARLGEDVSFLPYNREDRKLDFSRFDIGGVTNIHPETLDAFAFSERGIYRPGDTVHLAWAIKQRNWSGNLEGLPIEVEVTDARGKSALVKRLSLTREAFATLDFSTIYESPSGQYSFDIYLVRNNWREIRLGGTNFIVKEFQPDRMKLETKLNKVAGKGWITPDQIAAELTLRNLYGTPATNRRIVSTLQLSPSGFSFPEYADYTFYDRLLDQEKNPHSQNIELPEQMTGPDGIAQVFFGLEAYATATWQMNYYAEAFEGNSGRCVTGQASAIVSAQPWLVGHKTDGDLAFLQVNTQRTVNFIAVNPSLEKIPLENLEARLIEQKHLSMLVKKSNGNYAYESVAQDDEVSRVKVSFTTEGLTWNPPTKTPGDFVYELWNEDGARVARIEFRVVGAGELTRSLDRNAELQIQLDKPEYNAGDTMQVSLRAPYTGSGLISIESNHVHSFAWFKTDSASSVQTIQLPPDFEGTGYVSVAFIRGLDSKEIFTSPLSYGIVPFKANFDKRRMKIDLTAKTEVKPGEKLTIRYKSDRPGKIILFAVDKGILQVTDYKTPDPLAWFFRKTRIETETSQIVDLLIPEFSLLRQHAVPGGGEEGKLNPFRRMTEKPVVWWSGIVDVDATGKTLDYDVPDYFNGTLQVMAVSIGNEAVGTAESAVLVRGPFIITPGVPLAVAPGDEFEAGVTVANNRVGSGPDALVKLEIQPSPQLELISPALQEIKIPENQEVSTTVRVRVKQKLGAASLNFVASEGGEASRLAATLSVRPATPFMVELRSANFRKVTQEMPLLGGWFDEYRQGEATISAVPLGLAKGLDFYLKNYPHGCSEQITSGAFARLVLADEADFGQSRELVQAQMNLVYAKQSMRQAGNGSFGYWTADESRGADFISVYVMHFLIEAKAAGFNPPTNLLDNGLRHLKEIAAMEPRDLNEARTISYAIYLLTREQQVTTNYVLNLQDTLEQRWKKQWRNDLISSYLAATWKMLKDSGKADDLIKGFQLGRVAKSDCHDYYDNLSADSSYLTLLAQHFPERLKQMTPVQYAAFLAPIGEGQYNTLSAAYAVLALKSYAQYMAINPPKLHVSGVSLDGNLVQRGKIPSNISKLIFGFEGKPGPLGVYGQTLEAGFQIQAPKQVVNQGMEVWHEFVDENGATVTKLELGKPVTVRVVARSTEKNQIENVAIIDLVPGGFEIVPESIKVGTSNLPGIDYVEVREDRVILFGKLARTTSEWKWQLRAVSKGKFTVPPAYAESMYDRSLKSHGVATNIEVVQP